MQPEQPAPGQSQHIRRHIAADPLLHERRQDSPDATDPAANLEEPVLWQHADRFVQDVHRILGVGVKLILIRVARNDQISVQLGTRQ